MNKKEFKIKINVSKGDIVNFLYQLIQVVHLVENGCCFWKKNY